jgi:acyl-coenzyme A synthetase/AMP-(fatty) acid ligase
MGMPTPGHDVRVLAEDGSEQEPGEVGDVAVRDDAPSIFAGYWQADEATRRTRRGSYYVTGDRAYRDDDGYFWFVGRADDIIISSGYRIGPFEVESALVEHPAVLEAAVVSSPDPDRGEVVKAFITLRQGYGGSPELAHELQEHCKRVTAPYKYPRKIEFVDGLPKTTSGKIRRVELRQQEWSGKGV